MIYDLECLLQDIATAAQPLSCIALPQATFELCFDQAAARIQQFEGRPTCRAPFKISGVSIKPLTVVRA